jgi:hypothetical protein
MISTRNTHIAGASLISKLPYDSGMAVCSVLRCTAQTAHVMPMAPPEVGIFEAAVCHEHKHAIDAGAQYTYDTADHVIYMGRDVAAAGHHVVRSIRLSQLETLMPDLGDVPIIAQLACETRGSEERQIVSLVFTQEMALASIDALVRLVPPHRLVELLGSRLDK